MVVRWITTNHDVDCDGSQLATIEVGANWLYAETPPPTVPRWGGPAPVHKLVHSEFIKKNIVKYCVTFPCGHCGYCNYMNTRKNIILPNGVNFYPKHYINCRTSGIVYLLTCDCGSFCVGKTKLEFWRCIYRHVASIQKRDPSLPLGRHSALMHKLMSKNHIALNHIDPTLRGGDYNKLLLPIELKWIFLLRATTAPVLNEAFNFRPYLLGFVSGICERDL